LIYYQKHHISIDWSDHMARLNDFSLTFKKVIKHKLPDKLSLCDILMG